MRRILVAAIAGAVLGFVGARILFVGSALSLIPWALVGLILGSTTSRVVEAVKVGLVYGFCLSFVFMVAGYEGSASLLSRITPFALIGLFGGVCGLVLGLSGYAVKRFISRPKKSADA